MNIEESIILAIESSRYDASLSILSKDNEKRVALEANAKQGSELLPLLNNLIKESGYVPKDITDIAIHTGPGSATGLRMGIAMVQAFSFVYPDLRIHALPLEALALEYLLEDVNANDCKKALLLSDAFAGAVFVQEYSNNGVWKKEGEIYEATRDEVLAKIETAFIVDALGSLKQRLEWPESWVWSEKRFPDVTYVSSALKSDEDYSVNISDLDVRYLKASSAEINWQKKKGSA